MQAIPRRAPWFALIVFVRLAAPVRAQVVDFAEIDALLRGRKRPSAWLKLKGPLVKNTLTPVSLIIDRFCLADIIIFLLHVASMQPRLTGDRSHPV